MLGAALKRSRDHGLAAEQTPEAELTHPRPSIPAMQREELASEFGEAIELSGLNS